MKSYLLELAFPLNRIILFQINFKISGATVVLKLFLQILLKAKHSPIQRKESGKTCHDLSFYEWVQSFSSVCCIFQIKFEVQIIQCYGPAISYGLSGHTCQLSNLHIIFINLLPVHTNSSTAEINVLRRSVGNSRHFHNVLGSLSKNLLSALSAANMLYLLFQIFWRTKLKKLHNFDFQMITTDKIGIPHRKPTHHDGC